jgi:hypothetical protein
MNIRSITLRTGAAIATFLSGCAQSPDAIQPAYVSSVPFESWSCNQLGHEQSHLNAALATASVQQSQARTNDVVGVLLIGLPLSSMSGENIAPQIARLKGEQDAVRRALLQKECESSAQSLPSVSPRSQTQNIVSARSLPSAPAQNYVEACRGGDQSACLLAEAMKR